MTVICFLNYRTLLLNRELISEIPFGLTVFLGVKAGDTEKEGAYIAKKIAGLESGMVMEVSAVNC